MKRQWAGIWKWFPGAVTILMYGPLWFVLLLSVRGFLSGVISKQESKIHVKVEKVRLRSSHVLRADCLCAASGFVEGLLAGQRTGQAHLRTSSWAAFVGTPTLFNTTHPYIHNHVQEGS